MNRLGKKVSVRVPAWIVSGVGGVVGVAPWNLFAPFGVSQALYGVLFPASNSLLEDSHSYLNIFNWNDLAFQELLAQLDVLWLRFIDGFENFSKVVGV